MLGRRTLTAAIGMAAASVLLTAPTATAAPLVDEWSYDVVYSQGKPYPGIRMYHDGVYAGVGWWSENPGGDLNGDGRSDPGDSIIAHDTTPDTLGIETRLDTGRIATTRGHNSPYWSPWATGDLAENQVRYIKVCMVKGTWEACSSWVAVET